MTSPIVVYVPLTMQNVAKYRTWLLCATVSNILFEYHGPGITSGSASTGRTKGTYRYPVPPTALEIMMKSPRVRRRSDHQDKRVMTTAVTA
jgi:hypothetical protein